MFCAKLDIAAVRATRSNQYSHGFSIDNAIRRAVSQFALTGKPCPVVALDNHGKFSMQSTARLFSTASACSNHKPTVEMSCTTYYPSMYSSVTGKLSQVCRAILPLEGIL